MQLCEHLHKLFIIVYLISMHEYNYVNCIEYVFIFFDIRHGTQACKGTFTLHKGTTHFQKYIKYMSITVNLDYKKNTNRYVFLFS